MTLFFARLFTVLVLLLFAPWHTHAKEVGKIRVDTALVLAMDTSGSIDAPEFALQRAGYAAAFLDDGVVAALTSGKYGRSVVTFVQWSGPYHQMQVIGWRIIASSSDAAILAATISAMPRAPQNRYDQTIFSTSISAALRYSTTLLTTAPFSASRLVIDISGDGVDEHTSPSRESVPLMQARQDALDNGITINGLPILEAAEPSGTFVSKLESYYSEYVIGGPGCFLIAAKGNRNFAEAIRRKLVEELMFAQR